MSKKKYSKSLSNKINFLIVEDMNVQRDLIIKDLEKLGIVGTIYQAKSLEEAHKLCEEKIQCILADWILPDGTGYDLLLTIKKN